jgi:hypothetical protein
LRLWRKRLLGLERSDLVGRDIHVAVGGVKPGILANLLAPDVADGEPVAEHCYVCSQRDKLGRQN